LTQVPSPEYAFAARALAAEEEAPGGAADPMAAGERALGRLRGQLLMWFGPDGVHALFARAINRAATVHPMLAAVRPTPENGRHLDRVACMAPEGPAAADAREALLVLLATLFALLARLVGHDLVQLMTTQIWPLGAGQDDRPTETRSRIRE
jgi:hypothetical protein